LEKSSGISSNLNYIYDSWMVGDNGVVLKSDGAENWSQVALNKTTNNLHGITFNGENIWAVGDNGTIISSNDNGVTWLNDTSGTTQKLNSITYYKGIVWVVGDNGTI
jgi:photosystem II stability/assembly factor-like uncharacterized protein